MNINADVVRTPLPAVSTWVVAALIVVVTVVWAWIVMTAFSAGFDAPLSQVSSGTAELMVSALTFAVIVGAAAVLVRAGHLPALPVVIAGEAVVVAASLPVHWRVRVLIVAAGALVAVRVLRHARLVGRPAAVCAAVAVAAVIVSLVGAWQWGRELRAAPIDAPNAPVSLSFVVRPTEGLLELDGSTRCMVRVGELWIDPTNTESYLWLAFDAGWSFIVRPCAATNSS